MMWKGNDEKDLHSQPAASVSKETPIERIFRKVGKEDDFAGEGFFHSNAEASRPREIAPMEQPRGRPKLRN